MFWKHAKTIFYFFSIFFVQKVCVPNLWNLEVSSKIYAKINSSPSEALPDAYTFVHGTEASVFCGEEVCDSLRSR